MEFLKAIFGDELYKQAKAALDAYNGDEANKDKQVKLVNVANGDYVSKLKYDDLNTLLTSKGDELTAANTLIEELKKGTKGNDDLQGKVTEYETQVADLQEQLKQTQIESAVKIALLGAKATDIDYMTFKLKEKGELELAEDGSIKGIDDKLSALKTQFPTQFEGANGKDGRVYDVNKLPEGDNNSGVTKEAFEKMGYQDRLKLYNENPETYAELSKN